MNKVAVALTALFSGKYVSSFQTPFATTMNRSPKRMKASLASDVSHTSRSDGPSSATKVASNTTSLLDMHIDTILDPSTPRQKYGTPVGIVRLPNTFIQPFRQVIQEALPELKSVFYRGVDPCSSKNMNNGEEKKFKDLHVQTEVAAAIMEGNVQLIDYIKKCGGTFLSGARRSRDRSRRMNGSGKFSDMYSDSEEEEDGDEKLGLANEKNKKDQKKKFTFVELFAGIGGFRFGLEAIGGKCVLASERDEVACAIYRRQFGPNDLIEGDVLDVVSEDYPPGGFDLLTAGFPCQPFSARGEQKGLDDDGHRGQMYQELVRTLMEERPKYFLFENVVGLLKMDGGVASHRNGEHVFKPGKVMNVILDAFRSCGYKVQWHVVNSKHFIPQHRERVYFFGSLLELDCPELEWSNIYPTPALDVDDDTADSDPKSRKPLREYLEKDYATNPDVAECELTKHQWEMVQQKCNGDAKHFLRLKVEDPCAPTLISSYRTPASASTRFVMEEADGTLRHGNPLLPRFLTPTEFRRIMGFPSEFDVSPITKDNGAGHIYQVMGNAVVPPVIEAIGREIVALMERVEDNKN